MMCKPGTKNAVDEFLDTVLRANKELKTLNCNKLFRIQTGSVPSLKLATKTQTLLLDEPKFDIMH